MFEEYLPVIVLNLNIHDVLVGCDVWKYENFQPVPKKWGALSHIFTRDQCTLCENNFFFLRQSDKIGARQVDFHLSSIVSIFD